MENFSFFVTSLTAIFMIVDPFAVLPLYLSLTDSLNKHERLLVCRRACIIASGILLLFIFCGLGIFKILGITLPAFQIAGGILLLRIGIAQLNSERKRVREDEQKESYARDDISVFPLATPLLAGPAAISTVVLLSTQVDNNTEKALLGGAAVAAMFLSFCCFYFATMFVRFLGRTGLNLVTRLMGIILTAIAVQFVVNGVLELIKQYR